VQHSTNDFDITTYATDLTELNEAYRFLTYIKLKCFGSSSLERCAA